MPAFNAAAATTSLNVDPGGERSVNARLRKAVWSSACNDFHALVMDEELCELNVFGSNVGVLTAARIAPVFGSMATTAPRRGWPLLLPISALYAALWAALFSVRSTLPPRGLRPVRM